jgi:hypothetical protein
MKMTCRNLLPFVLATHLPSGALSQHLTPFAVGAAGPPACTKKGVVQAVLP